MFFGKTIVGLNLLFCIGSACYTKKGRLHDIDNAIECDFKNLTTHELFANYPAKKKYIYLNASKSNIAVLPCFQGDLMKNQISYFSSSVSALDLLKQVNESASIVGSPLECQSLCQYWDECKYFTYKLDTNQCWIIISDVPIYNGKIQNSYFISGPKFCSTLSPASHGGFEIKIKAWAGVRKASKQNWIGFPVEAWQGCKRICATNKNCESFNYCFDSENKNNEIFTCYFKGIQESKIKTPSHCVKSVKKKCYEIN